MDGCLDVWDYFYKQNDPTLQVGFSCTQAMQNMRCCAANRLLHSAALPQRANIFDSSEMQVRVDFCFVHLVGRPRLLWRDKTRLTCTQHELESVLHLRFMCVNSWVGSPQHVNIHTHCCVRTAACSWSLEVMNQEMH